jgi:hypothetical protein
MIEVTVHEKLLRSIDVPVYSRIFGIGGRHQDQYALKWNAFRYPGMKIDDFIRKQREELKNSRGIYAVAQVKI